MLWCNLSPAIAQETKLMIRAKAKDAKFIGSSIGGAKIIVKNSLTGEILAQGLTAGSTGNTKKIMEEPVVRHQELAEESTAGFEAILDVKEPTLVNIEGFAPLNKQQARVKSSTELWVIPGKDITGDGIILEFPGFVIDILSPQTHEILSAKDSIELKANIVMMCGCPITKGGLWDANQYEVKALITGENGQSKEIKMEQKEKVSTFFAKAQLESGLYEVLIYAFDPVTGNTGVDKTNIIIK
ncbi:hypothetical protein LPB144_01420 [Christiangramia salexigens]|uniref:Uncharacterized protein n=2 Tax=Christiangramia salexigens TaxID=1913577 RepID=A0A1L3J873_9FLAO|nr:hypothetical protein LPB144_01420 [Christiangramia salexigens]